MATLAAVKKVALKFRATVVDEKSGYSHCCRVEAPHRHKWSEGEVHELVDDTNRPWKPDYADLISRMNYGIEECTDPDCDWCNDGEESDK